MQYKLYIGQYTIINLEYMVLIRILMHVDETLLFLQSDRFCFTLRSPWICQRIEQTAKFKQIDQSKTAPPGRDHDERIRGDTIRPGGRNIRRMAFCVVEIDPIFTPCIAIRQDVEFLATDRVIRMRHEETS